MRQFYSFFTLVAATALFFAACTKNNGGTTGKVEPAILQFTIASAEGGTRTLSGTLPPHIPGDLGAGAGNGIVSYFVWVVDGLGNIIACENYYTAVPSAAPTRTATITTTTAAKDIYVLTYRDDKINSDMRAFLSGMTTKSQLEKFVLMVHESHALYKEGDTSTGDAYVDLDLDLYAAQCDHYARWATGVNTSPITWTYTTVGSTTTASGSVNIACTFVAARITVKIIDDMDDYTHGAAGSLRIERVGLFNAANFCKIFGSSRVVEPLADWDPLNLYSTYTPGHADSYFYHGNHMFDFSGGTFPNATERAWTYPLAYMDGATQIGYEGGIWTSDPLYDYGNVWGYFYNGYIPGVTFYYYTAPRAIVSSPDEYPTIVTLVGTRDGEAVFFPVHLAAYEEFLTGGGDFDGSLQPGKSYDLTLRLKGDPSGVTDPTVPSTTVEVNLEVNNWTPIDIDTDL